jgi:hypothetical protein
MVECQRGRQTIWSSKNGLPTSADHFCSLVTEFTKKYGQLLGIPNTFDTHGFQGGSLHALLSTLESAIKSDEIKYHECISDALKTFYGAVDYLASIAGFDYGIKIEIRDLLNQDINRLLLEIRTFAKRASESTQDLVITAETVEEIAEILRAIYKKKE